MNPQSVLRRLLAASGALLLCALGQATLAATTTHPEHMEERLAACTSCHGDRGQGSPTNPGIPRLAGKPAGYLLQQLHYFRNGSRHHAPMEYVVRQLSPAYLSDIANYFAAQKVPHRTYPIPAVPQAVLARGRTLVDEGDPARGVPSCKSCHGDALAGVTPMIPGLTGLSYAYIATQLELWRSHQRAAGSTFCMGVVANRMQPADVKAVSAWLAHQTPDPDAQAVPESELATPIPGWCVTGEHGGSK